MTCRQPAPCYRLFFAIKPDPVEARRIDHFAEGLAGTRPRIRLEHQHVTLAITQDHAIYPDALIGAMLGIGANIMAEPFDLMLDHLQFWAGSVALRPSRREPMLYALQREMGAAMSARGIALRPGWKFSPHQTLFHRKGSLDQRAIEGFCWRADRFMLVCSHVGHTRHERLGTWPLRGGAQYRLL
ncbi:2'-5' RNA ligase [Sphingobium sp. AN558]|uniref:2'-5' RNA ligase family protein n=1 Tax=Sphingobium sp. AN558 TaxID=3133442 RepID=UPI0030BA791F